MLALFNLIPIWIKITILAIILVLIAGVGGYGYMKGLAKGELKVAYYAKEKSDMQAEYERKLSEKKVEIVTKYVDKWNM